MIPALFKFCRREAVHISLYYQGSISYADKTWFKLFILCQ